MSSGIIISGDSLSIQWYSFSSVFSFIKKHSLHAQLLSSSAGAGINVFSGAAFII